MLNNKDNMIMKCLEGIETIYAALGRSPTVDEYDRYAKDNGLIQRRNLEKKMEMKWSEICRSVIGISNQYEKSKDEIYSELLAIKNKLGRTPMASELRHHDFNFKQCYRAFGMTYNETVKSFGWKAPDKKWIKKNVNELINDFIRLYNELGRLPTPDDIDDCEYAASYSSYKKKIGSIMEICKLANIEIENIIDELNISCGHLFLNKNNEICLSQAEFLISNFLIDNNVSYIKEYSYKNIIPYVHLNTRFDWYLNDANAFVEYFGLFDKKQLGKDSRLGKYSARAVEKMNLCKEYKINLIPLFKNDLKNNLCGVKNKLFPYTNKS